MNIGRTKTEEQLRVVTGLLLAIVIVVVVLLFDTVWRALIFGVVAAVAAWEWVCLLGDRHITVVAISILLALLWGGLFFLPMFLSGMSSYTVVLEIALYTASLWWFLMFVLVSAYHKDWHDKIWLHWYFRVGLFVVLVSAWLVIAYLSIGQLLYLLLLITVSDIGAYYTGRRWGKRKLIPELSAGKTVAGLWGGLICAAVVALTVGLGSRSWLEAFDFMLFSLFIVLAGVIGDLGISMLKRKAKRKHSSFLLPGHGGVLDRIDSILAASPIFLLIMRL